jgi:hypothetical protein
MGDPQAPAIYTDVPFSFSWVSLALFITSCCFSILLECSITLVNCSGPPQRVHWFHSHSPFLGLAACKVLYNCCILSKSSLMLVTALGSTLLPVSPRSLLAVLNHAVVLVLLGSAGGNGRVALTSCGSWIHFLFSFVPSSCTLWPSFSRCWILFAPSSCKLWLSLCWIIWSSSQCLPN